MPEISEQVVKQLGQAARLLQSIAASLDPSKIELSAEAAAHVAERTSNRLCLQCGNSLADEERVTRGLCGKCYARTMQRFTRHTLFEAEVIAEGMILRETKPGGRKATGPDPMAKRLTSGQPSGQAKSETAKKRGKTQQTPR